jgi:hypothetical protein
MIQEIKDTMKVFYAFELTDEQVQEYLDKTYIDGFDTVERETFAWYLSNKITGMQWPINCDADEYKMKFYKTLIENAPKMGYIWNP